MNIYETWLYEHLINATWFLWSIIGAIFTLNFLSGILVWLVLRGKKPG